MVTAERPRMVCDDRKITGGLLPEQAVASAWRTNDARLLAGPGTGKTKTIVEHVVNLIRDAGVAPTEILCLTFTRAAAAGMRRKIGEALGVGVPPRGLHAPCLRIEGPYAAEGGRRIRQGPGAGRR